MTYIYLVENCYGDSNKVYIGKTKNPNKRKNDHKRTYGSEDYIIIDQVDSLDRKKWRPIETMWIQSFIGWGFDVVNPRKEGGGGMESWTEEQKHNKSLQAKQMWDERSEEEKNTMAIKQSISKTGTNGYPKGQPRTEENRKNMIGKNGYPKGQPRTEKTKQKMRKPKGPQSQEHIQKRLNKSIGKTRNNKPITQYDLEGNFIQDWPSRKEAEKWLGKGDIAGCLAGKQKQAGGYLWKYKK